MSCIRPSDFPALFAATFSRGNLESVLALYMLDGVLIDQHGKEHRGHKAIGALLQPALFGGAMITITPQSVVEYGDFAVLRNDFQLTMKGQVLVKSTSFELLRLSDGSWKLAVDCPYSH